VRPADLRRKIRDGAFSGPTAGCRPGYVQANLVGLPAGYYRDFYEFCRKNSAPCPLLEALPPGVYSPSRVAEGANLLTDIPLYDIFESGEYSGTVENLEGILKFEMAFFLLGCSFSFESAMVEAGIGVRHVEEGKNVPMYRTVVDLVPHGPFRGKMVMTMRPVRYDRVVDVVLTTSRYPLAHGAPIHVGYPRFIGVNDLDAPDFGDPVSIRDDEIPVFWACGVTPRSVIENARITFAVMHHPGHMFVTDLRDVDILDKREI
jgi:uncharacterized protein YcsI (UPF0317 family)